MTNLADSGRARRLALARTRFPAALVARIERGLFETDTLADAVVETLHGKADGWRGVDRALAGGRAEVPALAALLASLQPPDLARVRHGAEVWWRFFPANVIGLSGALLTGYAHGDLVKPQALNGRSLALAGRRYEETARWLFSATEPGALVPYARGFRDTLRIRLVHAVVRRRLRARADWDRAAWGEPIHQTGTCLTNLGFYRLPERVSELLGMRFSDAERESVRALWSWIGTLMGLPDDLLPHSRAWAERFSAATRVILAPADHDSHVLTRSALRGGVRLERALPPALWRVAAPVLRPLASRLVYGTSHAILRRMNEPARGAHPALRLLRPWLVHRERARRLGLLGNDAAIAARQRQLYARSLARVKAEPHALRPERA